MAKKKTNTPNKKKQVNTDNVIGLHSEVTAQPITETLETNYMPYAMSTNVSRAFPEIDGFKPSHRQLLYTFPNILVSANKGIGVAMASDICGFNLNEVCTATMHFLEDPSCDLLEYMPMPDFSTGGEIIYRREEMERISETGLGSFQIRSRWRWSPEERIIEVYEIPYPPPRSATRSAPSTAPRVLARTTLT